MKTLKWHSLLTEQARRGKVLFTLTELANTAVASRRVVNVEMTRLVKYGVAARYAKGLYGLAGSVVLPEQLVSSMDPHAYITGAYALMKHGLVTQVPTVITCFTTRRHFRREMQTAVGRFEFVCVKPPVYHRDAGVLADAETALCDCIYVALRRGLDPARLLTFRRLDTLRTSVLARVLRGYPSTVRRRVNELMNTNEEGGNQRSGNRTQRPRRTQRGCLSTRSASPARSVAHSAAGGSSPAAAGRA